MNKFTTISTKDYTPLSYKEEYFHNKYELIQSFISEKIGEDFSDILAGGEVGKVTATLTWLTKDDLEIMAKQPNAKELSPAKQSDLSTLGEYDVDVNYEVVPTKNAVENIFSQNSGIGKYQLGVRLFKRRTTGSTPIHFTLQLKVEGQGFKKQQGKLNKTGNYLVFDFQYKS
jgi:hypothetical protein